MGADRMCKVLCLLPKEDNVDPYEDERQQKLGKLEELRNRLAALDKSLTDLTDPSWNSRGYLSAVDRGQILPSDGMLEKIEQAVADLERGGTH